MKLPIAIHRLNIAMILLDQDILNLSPIVQYRKQVEIK